MKILITGSTGHIPSFLIKKFIRVYKKKIILLNRRNAREYQNISIDHDLSQSSFKIPDEVSYIIHFASITPRSKHKNFALNPVISKNLLESINNHRKIKKLINISTIAIYNSVQKNKIVNEITSNFSNDIYALSKLKSEHILKKANSSKIYNLRIPAVLVNKKSDNFISNLINDIFKENKIILFNKDNKFNNILSIDDLYKFINQLLLQNFPSGDILLGTSKPISIDAIINFIVHKYKKKAKVLWKSNNKGFHIKINKTISNYEYRPKDTIKTIEAYINKHFNKYVQ